MKNGEEGAGSGRPSPGASRHAPRFETYSDPFYMPCGWPVGMAQGNGHTLTCMEPARFRVIFPSGGRNMLCWLHKTELEARSAPSPQGEGPSSPYLGMTGKEIQQEVNRRQSAQVEKLFKVPPHPHPSEGRP